MSPRTAHADGGAVEGAATEPGPPGPGRLLPMVFAVAIIGGPLGYLVGGALSPSIHVSGRATIAAYDAANPVANGTHLAAFVVASFLLPVGAAGLAVLAHARTPRLATAGGLLGVLGWLPLSALAALDDLATTMAGLPGSARYAPLLDEFTTDTVMSVYLITYVLFHLAAYVVLGVALDIGRVIPRRAAWSLVASSPLTVLAFAIPGDVGDLAVAIGIAALSLLVVGSLPAARAALRMGGRTGGRTGSLQVDGA
jgi:hypothetical protein